jgi:TPR repeat protein
VLILSYITQKQKLTYIYLMGISVKRDVQKAIEFYQRAVDAGNTEANLNLGDIYHKGDKSVRDIKAAFD